jgi:hypothetical protein
VSAEALDRTLAALADPHRRRVVDLLRERPRRAGELVEEDRDELDSRVRIYRLRPEPMADLKAWLTETEALWARQLLAFKAHLYKNRK